MNTVKRGTPEPIKSLNPVRAGDLITSDNDVMIVAFCGDDTIAVISLIDGNRYGVHRVAKGYVDLTNWMVRDVRHAVSDILGSLDWQHIGPCNITWEPK